MAIINKYPYHDYNDLNLDWIIRTVKETVAEWAAYHAQWDVWQQNTNIAYQNLHDYVMNYFDNLDIEQELRTILDDMDQDGSLKALIEEYFMEWSADIQSQLNGVKAAVGGPLMASTVAAMTDHNRVYVYTGSESGYTSGNWYYWSGSAWVSGGVYNSSALETDKTLTVSDMAADAKVTGDKINALNSLVARNYEMDTAGYMIAVQSPNWYQGSIVSASGAAGTSSVRIRTDTMIGSCDALVISLPAGCKVAVYGYVRTVSSAQYAGLISNYVEPDQNGLVYVPITKGIAYALCVGYTDDSEITTSAADNIAVYKARVPGRAYEEMNAGGILEDGIVIPGRFLTWERGTIRATGEPLTSNEYCIFTPDPIPVHDGDAITLTGGTTATAVFACFYDSTDTFLTREDLLNGSIPIPEEARYIRFTYGNTTGSGIKVTDGMDLIAAFQVRIMKSTYSSFLAKIGHLEFGIRKGYWTNSGTISSQSVAVCADRMFDLPVGMKIRVLIREPNWVYSVKQGSDPAVVRFTDRLVNYSEFEVTARFVCLTFYKTDEAGEMIDLDVNDFDDSIILFQEGYTTSKETQMHDVPENIGVLNVINRAYQMAKLTYTTAANLPTQVNTEQYPHYIPAGETVEGVMYSSVRTEGLYVPQAVSLQAYMTAILNANSYIYTKTEPAPHPNALTYYGAVCSSMVAWCYGIDDVIPTTISFDTYPGMEVIENQSPYGLKLGDMLNRSDVHIVIVTDIIRNNRGIISQIEVTDQINNSSHPMTRHRYLTPESIQTVYFDAGYVAYRYHYIYAVPYEPSPWINLDNETEEPVYSTNLSPRRGDQANWRSGENVVIDVLDATGYTLYRIYKNGTLLLTDDIPANRVITLTGLDYGHYSAVLTDGTNESDPAVYFDIINAVQAFTPLGGGKVTATYSSANGTPCSISFCMADSTDSEYKGVKAFHILTSEEVAAGEATLDAPNTGSWLMKVEYKTDYGLYSGDLTSVTIS